MWQGAWVVQAIKIQDIIYFPLLRYMYRSVMYRIFAPGFAGPWWLSSDIRSAFIAVDRFVLELCPHCHELTACQEVAGSHI